MQAQFGHSWNRRSALSLESWNNWKGRSRPAHLFKHPHVSVISEFGHSQLVRATMLAAPGLTGCGRDP